MVGIVPLGQCSANDAPVLEIVENMSVFVCPTAVTNRTSSGAASANRRRGDGAIHFVPPGEKSEPTRPPEYYDETFRYLAGVGVPVLA